MVHIEPNVLVVYRIVVSNRFQKHPCNLNKKSFRYRVENDINQFLMANTILFNLFYQSNSDYLFFFLNIPLISFPIPLTVFLTASTGAPPISLTADLLTCFRTTAIIL